MASDTSQSLLNNPPSTTPAPAIRAYLGGSFDPIHLGHLQMAMAVYHALLPFANTLQRSLQVSLLPNARSPFKAHSSEPRHRLAMLELAITDLPINICTLELWQTPPVFSIDTVQSLRAQYPNDSLIFIMGADSAATLERWRQGLHLTDYVHLWIFNRHIDADINSTTDITQPISTDDATNSNASTKWQARPQRDHSRQDRISHNISTLLPDALQSQLTQNVADLLDAIHPACDSAHTNILAQDIRAKDASDTPLDLKARPIGRIYNDNTDILAVSSTQLRQALRTANDDQLSARIAQQALPIGVYDYIREHHLYCSSDFGKINH